MADGSVPDIVHRSDALHVRAIRVESRECDFIASTETIDSYEEVIDAASWQLGIFKTNPVCLFQHDRWSLPVGQATRCEVVNGQLECTIKFASAEANPQAEQVWKLVQEKVLRAVSVGFKPTDGKWEMRNGRDVYVIYGAVLREISVVSLPANPDCLAQMKAASLADCDEPTRERIRSAGTARDTQTKTTPELPAPSLTLNDGAKSATEQNQMDPKEMQAKIDQANLAVATAQLAEKNANEARTKAEADCRSNEAQVKTLTTEKAALEAQTKSLADARDAEKVRGDGLEAQLIDLEVESEIGPGKKIAPAEKEMFVELRKTNPALFTKMLAQRSPMTLDKAVIPGADPTANAAKALNGAGTTDDVLEEAQKLGS